MKPEVARNLIYFPIQKAMGGNLQEAMRLHIFLERRPKDALEEYQRNSLAELLRHCFENIPFYRALCQDRMRLGDPFDILKTLPLMSKKDLRENLPILQHKEYPSFWRSTSGSTGVPFHFCKDRFSLLQMDASMHAVYLWHGIEIGDRQARIWGRALSHRKQLTQGIKDILLNRRRLSAFDINPKSSRVFFESLLKFQPHYIYGYPNAIMLFAQHLQKLELDTRSLSPKAIICTSEPVLEQHQKSLGEAFSCHVVSEYGNSENGILAMGCEYGNMHILQGNVIIEFLNEGKPARFGEMGEVVVTELHSRSIPFIRYRTGDMGIPLEQGCPCGRTFRLMQVACGRDHSFILCPDGRRVHAAIAAYILKKGVRQFRLIQEETDRLLAQVVPDNNYNEALERQFLRQFQEYCGRAMRVRFIKFESIPVEKNGKVLYFISRLSPHGAISSANASG